MPLAAPSTPLPTIPSTVHHCSRNREILWSLINCHSPLLLSIGGPPLRDLGGGMIKAGTVHLNTVTAYPLTV